MKEINHNFCSKAKEVLAQEVAGLEKRICLLLNIHQHGNESLLRIFENSDEFEGIEALDDILELANPNLPEGYLDLEAELNKLKETETEKQDEEDNTENLTLDNSVDDNDDDFVEIPEDKDDDFVEIPEDKDDDYVELPEDDNELEQKLLEEPAETLDYQSRYVFRADNMDKLIHDLL
jgi:hypothetical protein